MGMCRRVIALFFFMAVVCAIDDLMPDHIYLSLTGVPTQVQLCFKTFASPTHARVEYGLSGSNATITINVIAANILEFKRPVTGHLNYITSVTLEGLQPGKTYSYHMIGNTADPKNTTTKEFSFRHIPAAGEPVTLGIYGDLGSYGYALMQSNANGLPSWATRGKFDVVIHNGDLAYNLGTDNGSVGDAFMRNVQSVASVVPYIVTPGNHEFMNTGADEKYFKAFWVGQTLLGKNSKSTNPTNWFSFDIGAVHVVGISTEVYCEDTTNVAIQYAWLENDLKVASAKTPRPWIVMLGHRPLYQGALSHLHTRLMREGLQCTDATLKSCNPIKSCSTGKNCAYSIEDLLEKYKVDMFNAGHVHSYLRHNPIFSNLTYLSYPSNKQYVNPGATVHIISGAAGTENQPASSHLESVEASPVVVDSDVKGFSTLVAYNYTHLYYQQISAVNGDVLDDFWIIKNSDAPTYKLAPFTVDADSEETCDQ